jgi:methionine-rich copper-binding protein CopC
MRILLFALLMVAASPAAAHATLESASPRVGSTTAPTDTIRLDFNEGIEPRFSTVELFDAEGKLIATPKPTLADETALVLHLAAPLSLGRYRVKWHVLSVDAHRTKGDFSFTVAP